MLPHAVKNKLAMTLEELDALAAQPLGGTMHASRFLNNVSQHGVWTTRPDPQKPAVRVQLSGTLPEADMKTLQNFKIQLFTEIKEGLQDSFPEADVLNAFHIFDPKSYRHIQSVEQLKVFGRLELAQILKHVGSSFIDTSNELVRVNVSDQFNSMKVQLWQLSKQFGGADMKSAWMGLHDDKLQCMMPYMFKLVAIALVIPLNTACVERGFSVHNNVKNKTRSSLKIAQLDALLRVHELAGCFKDFDYQLAIDLYSDNLKDSLSGQLATQVSGLQSLFVEGDEEVVQDFAETEGDALSALELPELSGDEISDDELCQGAQQDSVDVHDSTCAVNEDNSWLLNI